MAESSFLDTWSGIAIAALAFLYFLSGILGYGITLRHLLVKKSSPWEEFGDELLLGSLVLCSTAFALASLHLLRMPGGWIWWATPLPGFFVFARTAPAKLSLLKKNWHFAVLFIFIFFLRGLSGAIPQEHGDPLLYHLLGPRVWVRAGGFLMDPLLPNALLASAWECLYVWPQLLWSQAKPLFGLVEAQVFSQWIHLFFGWGGAALLTTRLLKNNAAGKNLPLLGLAALFVSGLQWTAVLAKNDLGITFWVLGSVLWLQEGWRAKLPRQIFFSGVFAGLAIAGKITALLSLGPLCLSLFLIERMWRKPLRATKDLSLWAVGAASACIPFYMRNAVLSGNPFYPMFSERFPSPFIAPSWQHHFSQVLPSSPIHSLERIVSRAPELVHESPWILGLTLIPILLWKTDRRFSNESQRKWALLIAAMFAYVMFVTTQAKEIELRYLGASLLLLSAGGAACFLNFCHLFSERMERYCALVLLAALLTTSKLPLHILRKIWNSPIGVAYTNHHMAGKAKAWLRTNAGTGLVILVGENESYYLTPLSVTPLGEKPDIDTATRKETNLRKYISEICRLSHARYMLDSRPSIGGFTSRFGAEALSKGLVFSAEGALVYDLRRLEAEVTPGVQECR